MLDMASSVHQNFLLGLSEKAPDFVDDDRIVEIWEELQDPYDVEIDNGSNQKHQRNQRRRDPAPRPRNEPASGRKPAPQRSREFDKRPRSRGYYNDKPREEVTQERRAEPGSALRPGSKKGNLNHLLNFTFAPRDSDGIGRGGGRGSSIAGWKGRSRWSGKSTVKYSKERFLQANCQFIVRENVDYSAHAADPDTLVDWHLIEQVRIFSHEVPSCPICLYPPTAAKMTRCGHIYCWACILHYLSLEDKSWRKCPICYESIHKKDLKSVVALETHEYCAEQQITMKLMKRWRGSTYAMPRVQWTERSGKPHNLDDNVDVSYAKLLLANYDQVKKIVDAEKMELEQQLREEGDSLEGSFVQAALQLLMEREKTLAVAMDVKEEIKTVMDTRSSSSSELSGGSSSGDEASEKIKPWKNEDVVEYSDAFSDEVGETVKTSVDVPVEGDDGSACAVTDVEKAEQEGGAISTDDTTDKAQTITSDIEEKGTESESMSVDEAAEQLAIPTEPEKRTTGNQITDTYYYYQAEDGQHIYLHSVNARCMLKEYGSWEACPDTITATIVEIERVSMTEELRRRLRYLSNLPVTCEFQVAELAMQPPIVSSKTLSHFNDEIEKRRKLRQKRLREERQRSRKIRIDEDKKMGIYPGMRVNISSQRHFPTSNNLPSKTQDVFVRAVSPTESNASSNDAPFDSPPGLNPNAAEFTVGSPVSVGSSDDGHQSSSMSFAQMLRAGKAKPQVEAWPKVRKAEETTMVSKAKGESDGSDSEEQALVPVFQSSFGDAIEQALNKFKKLDVDVEEPVASTSISSVGGKKKNSKKKQLLFTTTMRRN